MSGGGAVNDDDTFTLIMLSPWLLPIISGLVLGAWEDGRDWALQYGLVADENTAILPIPGWGGAGLGGVHVVVLGSLVVLLTVLAGAYTRRRQRPHRGDMDEPPPFRSRL